MLSGERVLRALHLCNAHASGEKLGKTGSRGIRVRPRGPRDSALSGYDPDMEALEKK